MTEPTQSRTGLAVLVMIATPLFFSTNLLFGRAVIGDIAPFTLALIRWGLVAALLSPFLIRERRTLAAIIRGDASLVALLAFLGMIVCGGGVYVALTYTTATNGTLIYTTSSVFIILIEAAFLGRRIGWREALGSAIAFAGVGAIVLRGDLSALARLDFNWGDLIFVAAAIAWAVYSILYRAPALSKASNLALFALVALVAALMLLPAAALEFAYGGKLPVTAGAWAAIAGIVVFASLLAFSGFQYGVRVLGPSLAGIFMYLMPPFAVTMAVIFLGETFHAFHAAGIALVMGGVILATFPAGRLKRQPRVPSAGNVSSSQ
jgi:drug/metabolite transporter (DMT)-like permease